MKLSKANMRKEWHKKRYFFHTGIVTESLEMFQKWKENKRKIIEKKKVREKDSRREGSSSS